MAEAARNVVLLCNPRAGGRWRVLSDVLDSEEARLVRRIVTDDIDDIREAIFGLGQRVDLICVYGGDGTIFRVINELLRTSDRPTPRLAFLGGGTMNVTSAWCGMRSSPGENFRRVMRAYTADRLLIRSVPVLAVTQSAQTTYGFTFGIGPLVRILERFESGDKSKINALRLGLKTVAQAIGGAHGPNQSMLEELNATITVDGRELPYDRFSAVFANTTGIINPFVQPFVAERSPESFHFLAYAVSSREFALMAPLLARARLPIDPRSLLNPVSMWRQAMLSVFGRGQLTSDPRYVNQAAATLVLETNEPTYTIDGEVLASTGRSFAVGAGPSLNLVVKGGRKQK